MANEVWADREFGHLGNAGKTRAMDYQGDQSVFAAIRGAILYSSAEIELGTPSNPICVTGAPSGLLGTVTLAAGEAHIGEVGASSITVDVVPTIDTAAYAAGDSVGGLITLANAARVAGGSGVIQSLTLADADSQNEPYQIIFLSANPSGSTVTDQSPVNIVEADLAKIIGVVNLYAGDYSSFSATSVGAVANIGIGYDLPSGTSLFVILKPTSTPDYTQTDALKLGVHLLRN